MANEWQHAEICSRSTRVLDRMRASREDAGTAHFPASSMISSLMEGPSWQFNSLEKPARSGYLSAPSTHMNPLKNL